MAGVEAVLLFQPFSSLPLAYNLLFPFRPLFRYSIACSSIIHESRLNHLTNERTNVRVRSSVKVLRWPKIVCASVLYLLRAMRMLSCYLSLELELLIFEKVAAPCDIESLAPVHEGLAGHEFYTNGDVSTFSPGFRNHSITVLSLKTVTL